MGGGLRLRLTLPTPSSVALSECARHANFAGPIERNYAASNIAMKGRMRPVLNTMDEAVLDRIDVAIFDVIRVVGIISNEMFPEPALPYPPLTARDMGRG